MLRHAGVLRAGGIVGGLRALPNDATYHGRGQAPPVISWPGPFFLLHIREVVFGRREHAKEDGR